VSEDAARMKVFVTGAGGFIGSHLCEALANKKYKVKAFVKYNSRNFWGWLENFKYKENIKVISGNIRDYDSLKTAMRDVDIVFHLAALVGIPYSYISPLAYIRTNIEGTYNVLEVARELKIEKVVHTSTSEVYGTAQFIPITEEHPINPQSPYAATKAAADHLALSFYRSFGLPVTVIRPFNTYGPRQSARAIVPTIITQILSGRKRVVLGHLHPTRDLTYVKDTVEAFVKIAEKDDAIGEVINVGSDLEISVENLVKVIAGIIGCKVEVHVEKERQRPDQSEVKRLRACNKKAKKLLGWTPSYTLEEGLKETIEWFRENLDFYKPEIYNV